MSRSYNKVVLEFKSSLDDDVIWEASFDDVVRKRMNSHQRGLKLLDTFGVSKCYRYGDGQFKCSKCGRNWQSVKAMVVFKCSAENDDDNNVEAKPATDDVNKNIKVRLERIGQKCSHCSNHYQGAKFTRKQIETMLKAVYNEIVSHAFGGTDNLYSVPDGRQFYRGHGGPPHNTDSCESCKKGLPCGRNEIIRKKKKARSQKTLDHADVDALTEKVTGISLK